MTKIRTKLLQPILILSVLVIWSLYFTGGVSAAPDSLQDLPQERLYFEGNHIRTRADYSTSRYLGSTGTQFDANYHSSFSAYLDVDDTLGRVDNTFTSKFSFTTGHADADLDLDNDGNEECCPRNTWTEFHSTKVIHLIQIKGPNGYETFDNLMNQLTRMEYEFGSHSQNQDYSTEMNLAIDVATAVLPSTYATILSAVQPILNYLIVKTPQENTPMIEFMSTVWNNAPAMKIELTNSGDSWKTESALSLFFDFGFSALGKYAISTATISEITTKHVRNYANDFIDEYNEIRETSFDQFDVIRHSLDGSNSYARIVRKAANAGNGLPTFKTSRYGSYLESTNNGPNWFISWGIASNDYLYVLSDGPKSNYEFSNWNLDGDYYSSYRKTSVNLGLNEIFTTIQAEYNYVQNPDPEPPSCPYYPYNQCLV